MSTDEKAKQAEKDRRKLLVTLATAGFAAVTAVGDGARSYFERQDDMAKAAQADKARVDTDQAIQDTVTKALEDLHEKHDEDYDDLYNRLERLDRENFELRVEIAATSRVLEAQGVVNTEFRELLMLEALEVEAGKENVFVDTPKHVSADAPPQQTKDIVEKAAERVTEKKRKKRKERPAPKIEFEAPAPVYQFQQQMQQQLPRLPPPPKVKK